MKKIIIGLLLLLNFTFVFGQYTPNFKNYSISDYEGGNKNWGISTDSIGRVYIANSKGLLEYNGVKWNLWELPNKTIIRSVLVQGDKIYTGSFEEFGYWKRNEKGLLHYTSLTKKSNKIKFDQEYWQIIPYENSLYFRSFTKFYKVEGDIIKEVPTFGTITSCSVINNELLIFSSTLGVLKLLGEEFVKVPKLTIPENTNVNGFASLNDKSMLISTALNGCFVFDGDKLRLWKSEINPILKQHELNNILKLRNGNFAFGTIDNGIYLTDKLGTIIFHLNKESGLINNTVLTLNDNSKNELWLGLNNGLTAIDLNSKAILFNDIKGNLGAVYDIAKFEGTLYIGSNTGLYYIDKNNDLQFVKGSSGQVLELKVVNEDLFCGHNRGTFLVKKNQFVKISNYAGGWTMKQVIGEQNLMLQGTYSGLIKYEKNNNEWKVSKLINFNQPAKHVVFETKHIVWVAHPYKGLVRVKINDEFTNVVSSKNYENKGIWSAYKIKIFKIKNNIVFKTDKGWQRYEPLQDTIIPYELLSLKIGEKSEIISKDTDAEISIINGDDIYILPSFLSENKIHIPRELYKKRLVADSEKIVKINDSINALCLMDGFMLYKSSIFETNTRLTKPTIDYVQVNDELIDINSETIHSDFENNEIYVQFSSPKSKDYFFEYKLKPVHNTWKKNFSGELRFINLLEDDYEIVIRTTNNKGEHSVESVIKYTVHPPWFRGVVGIITYILLAILIIISIYVYNHKKLKTKKRILKIELEKEQRILFKENELENVKTLNQVKNEVLANDIKLKSKQLANTAMALVKKNEILVFLKKEFLLNKDKFTNQYTFKRLIKQIDKSIEHEDEWGLFEYNFNQVHKEFFDKLKAEFPQLTHKDLKLCAYIKMNLSTKEIAPLLNISNRGVETHRYRLKKKFLIENDSLNINSFLMKFN